jgi:hypothetical protein
MYQRFVNALCFKILIDNPGCERKILIEKANKAWKEVQVKDNDEITAIIKGYWLATT